MPSRVAVEVESTPGEARKWGLRQKIAVSVVGALLVAVALAISVKLAPKTKYTGAPTANVDMESRESGEINDASSVDPQNTKPYVDTNVATEIFNPGCLFLFEAVIVIIFGAVILTTILTTGPFAVETPPSREEQPKIEQPSREDLQTQETLTEGQKLKDFWESMGKKMVDKIRFYIDHKLNGSDLDAIKALGNRDEEDLVSVDRFANFKEPEFLLSDPERAFKRGLGDLVWYDQRRGNSETPWFIFWIDRAKVPTSSEVPVYMYRIGHFMQWGKGQKQLITGYSKEVQNEYKEAFITEVTLPGSKLSNIVGKTFKQTSDPDRDSYSYVYTEDIMFGREPNPMNLLRWKEG